MQKKTPEAVNPGKQKKKAIAPAARLRKERDWADGAAAADEAYEKTYRDGSAVNECWAEGRHAR